MTHELFAGKRTLVTGGLGFIGSNLCKRLVDLGARVTIVDSLIPQYGGNLFNVEPIKDSVRVNVSDVRDRYSMRYLVEGTDYLFNLAGQTSHMDSMQEPFADLDINARSQLSILESCRRYNKRVKVVFASTRQIYGRPQYLPVDEDHPLRPVDVNGINKVAGEWYHTLYHDVYGMATSVLRLTNTIGPGMRVKDARQTFLGVWVRRLVEGEPFEVWGGDQRRDFNYVDDVVEAFLLAAADERANGKVFNLGSDEVVSLKELADKVVSYHQGASYVVKRFPEDRKKIDIGDYYSDFARIRHELGWRPRTPLHQALGRTIAYYKEYIGAYL